jgi:hypothetical protein
LRATGLATLRTFRVPVFTLADRIFDERALDTVTFPRTFRVAPRALETLIPSPDAKLKTFATVTFALLTTRVAKGAAPVPTP